MVIVEHGREGSPLKGKELGYGISILPESALKLGLLECVGGLLSSE